MSTSVRLAADQIAALLQPLQTMDPAAVDAAHPAQGVFIYRGEVVDASGNPATPPADPDGRSHPHAIFYPAPGRPLAERLAKVHINTAWSFQITCVGGDENRALWTVDKVRSALLWRRITLDGAASGCIYEDVDSGPVRKDEDVAPARFYLPLIFETRI